MLKHKFKSKSKLVHRKITFALRLTDIFSWRSFSSSSSFARFLMASVRCLSTASFSLLNIWTSFVRSLYNLSNSFDISWASSTVLYILVDVSETLLRASSIYNIFHILKSDQAYRSMLTKPKKGMQLRYSWK